MLKGPIFHRRSQILPIPLSPYVTHGDAGTAVCWNCGFRYVAVRTTICSYCGFGELPRVESGLGRVA